MSTHILFIHDNPRAAWVQLDRALLAERFVVREWPPRGWRADPLSLLRAVAASDLVCDWRAVRRSPLPLQWARVWRRPTLALVQTDLQVPRATRLIAHSAFAAVRVTAQAPRVRIEVIAPAIEDCDCDLAPLKTPMALCVGGVSRASVAARGLEAFVRAAAELPQLPFVLAGRWHDDAIAQLRARTAPNVEFTGWVTPNVLREYYLQAQVYVQAASDDDFPWALAEAMSYECVPVVTRAGALPEVADGCGLYADSAQPAALAHSITQALALDARAGVRARARIAQEFSVERRRDALHELVEQLLSTSH